MPEPVPIYQLWQCNTCGVSGFVEALSSDDAKRIYELADQQHYQSAGANCRGPLRFRGEWSTQKPAHR